MKLLYRCTLHRAFWYIKKKKKERDKKKPTKKTQHDDNKHKPNDSWAEEKNQ